MAAPGFIRRSGCLLGVLCMTVLAGCDSEAPNPGTAAEPTVTTARRPVRPPTTTTTAAPRPRPVFVEEDPTAGSPATEQPVTAPVMTRPTVTEPPVTVIERPLTFYYEDCESAWAAGAAPLYYGYEGYWEALDPDGDGVACDY